jgi:hypothetical protein
MLQLFGVACVCVRQLLNTVEMLPLMKGTGAALHLLFCCSQRAAAAG